MANEKTYLAMVTEELCAQFVPNTGNYRFGNKDNGLCRYNDCVNCEDGYCANCGWNPSVARKRIRRIRAEWLRNETQKSY